MKFRKKPVVVEADQWVMPTGIMDGKDNLGVYFGNGKFFIDTLEGRHEVSDGDWIITGIKGEKYPCKPDIFEMTYEKIE